MSLSLGISHVPGTGCFCGPGQERTRAVLSPPVGQGGLAQLSPGTGWFTKARNGSLLGWGTHEACVPRSVVSPMVPPGRPTSSYQELAATGHCPFAGLSQWSPSLAKFGQVHSQCVFTVIFCEPLYHAMWQAGRGTGQRRD